jgi:hypothetical protein
VEAEGSLQRYETMCTLMRKDLVRVGYGCASSAGL